MSDDKKFNPAVRFILMCALCFLGVGSGFGSLNFGVTDDKFYTVAGIAGIALSIMVVISEYKRLKNND